MNEESYRALRAGMSFNTIIASPRTDFSKIVAVTDSFVPSCDIWVSLLIIVALLFIILNFCILVWLEQVGDYPYLNKENFVTFLSRLRQLPPKESERENAINAFESQDFRSDKWTKQQFSSENKVP